MKTIYFAAVVLALIGCCYSSVGVESLKEYREEVVSRTTNCNEDKIDPGVVCDGANARHGMTRYGYNSLTGECQEFVYLGCGGNNNNFLRKSDCESICGNRN